ncbi:hypothetical protein [Nostoc sp.]|uniref:hypothetical protein n=1 Tax=Nostoc sp. TaxID=1180 RepID=UPI002FF7658A
MRFPVPSPSQATVYTQVKLSPSIPPIHRGEAGNPVPSPIHRGGLGWGKTCLLQLFSDLCVHRSPLGEGETLREQVGRAQGRSGSSF